MKKNEPNTLSGRIVKALDITGTKKADLARAIDVRPQIIQFLCSSNTKSSRYTFEIAGALGINMEWLATGQGSMFPNYNISENIIEKSVIDDYSLVLNINNIEQLENTNSSDYIFIDKKYENHLAIKMNDDSMAPLIPKSALMIIETDKQCIDSAGDNDIVVVFYKPNSSILVRKITLQGNKLSIFPMNTDLFKAIDFDENVKLIGIVKHVRWDI